MTYEAITALASNTSLAVITLMTVGWWWICRRTGSSHALHMRLWRILTGNREISHPQIRAYIEEQDSLMAFRLSSGMRVKSATHADRAIAFVTARDLSPDLIRRVGDYFDADELRMASRPSNLLKIWLFFATAVLLLIFAIAGFASFEQRVLVSLKETGTWLWLSSSEAQAVRPALLGDRPILSFVECPKADFQGWSARDVAILCSIRTNPALGPYIEKTRKRQRVTFLVLATFSLVVAGSQWLEFLRANAAERLARQLDKWAATSAATQPINVAPEPAAATPLP
ncbi:DUF6216 family protein [Pseudoxanthomonas suwonensis]|uniref:DUF6216 family protein n=1 Tax=Pseudoxanthomonas suwonensis TaxID=314722 RepID=UPI000B088A15|nr:DUF6216 family protein [Pseudoxanthomonas suwonensis]